MALALPRSTRRRPRLVVSLLRVALAGHNFRAEASREEPRAQAQPSSGALTAEFEDFLHTHERPVLNYLWRMTGDEALAHDLTQETFLRAWQRYSVIRGYERPRAWLFRVATNLALTQRKRASSRETSLEDAPPPSGSDPAWRLAESDLVRRTLMELPPKRRAALVLREVYGFSSAEVGKTLGMTEVAVRMALHRGREQFRALYLRAGGPDHGD
jgi:RNA polymerase sigma-70 factor (ECF subfamily)